MESSKEIIFFILIGVLLIAMLIGCFGIVVLYSSKKFLEKDNALKDLENKSKLDAISAIVDAEEQQKLKIASDLHDHLIPEITIRSMSLNETLKLIQRGDKTFADAQKDLENIISLSNVVREIAYDIIPKMFTTFGFLRSLEIIVEQLNYSDKIRASFENETNHKDSLPFPIRQQLTLYRVITEIMQNLLKHSNYNDLTITLQQSKECLNFVFAHDGTGVTNEQIKTFTASSSGIGLKSLSSRMLSLRGIIDYKTETGFSYITISIPI